MAFVTGRFLATVLVSVFFAVGTPPSASVLESSTSTVCVMASVSVAGAGFGGAGVIVSVWVDV
ncbi:MAG: hypothetical protein ACXW19_03070 [Thermoanaerobaculia bacterium]